MQIDAPSHITDEQEEALQDLIRKVYDLIGNPVSTWAVAATIESLGVREIDVQNDFGYASIFELADDVYDFLKKETIEEHTKEKHGKLKFGGVRQGVKLFLKHYTAGMVFSMPMISQIIAILLFEYALWAWFSFNEAQATVVAFGTIIAFVITGGFIQTMGRLVSRYKGENNFYLAQKATILVLKTALPAVIIVAVAMFVLNIILPFYPQNMIILAIIYMVLISFLLLGSAILFATEQRTMILFGIVAGTAVVIAGMEFLNLGIYLSQWVGIIVGALIMYGYGFLYYRIKIKILRQELTQQELPNREVNWYNTYRYFIYGVCYFAFLFTDRILAWSAGPPPPAYIIWFNTPYELGMDWALISLVITIAMLEFSIHSFSRKLIPAQKIALINRIKDFNKYFRRFYFRQIILLLVVGTLSIILTYYGVLSLRVYQDTIPEIRDFFANPMTFRVFWFASVGYLLLIYGLLNSLFFFTMNRPEFVMYSMIGALVVNILVGFLCSRIMGLEYAVLGLVAGSFVFALTTGIIAVRFFKHLDYFYYSAY